VVLVTTSTVSILVEHIARVPLAVERGPAESTPVCPESEFCILEPVRSRRVLVRRCPGRAIALRPSRASSSTSPGRATGTCGASGSRLSSRSSRATCARRSASAHCHPASARYTPRAPPRRRRRPRRQRRRPQRGPRFPPSPRRNLCRLRLHSRARRLPLRRSPGWQALLCHRFQGHSRRATDARSTRVLVQAVSGTEEPVRSCAGLPKENGRSLAKGAPVVNEKGSSTCTRYHTGSSLSADYEVAGLSRADATQAGDSVRDRGQRNSSLRPSHRTRHHMSALKFLYTKTLWRPERVSFLSWPAAPQKLPTVLAGWRNADYRRCPCHLRCRCSIARQYTIMLALGDGPSGDQAG
jgi:hypothetical protein